MSDTVEERWTRHSEAGRRFMSERKYSEAEKAFLAAIKEARQLGAEDLRMAASLSSLGLLKYKQRDLVQAEVLLRQSLSIRERTLGSEHVGIVQSMSYLAAVYYARAELERADDLFRRALRISEKHLGEDHPDVATMISNLAQLHFKRGDFASAGQLLTRLLAIREKALGEHHPEVAAILSRLAQVRYAELDSEGAELLSRRSLAIRVRAENAAKEAAAPPKSEAAVDAPRPVEVPRAAEPKPAPVVRPLTASPLAPRPFGDMPSQAPLAASQPVAARPQAALASPASSLQGWAERLPVEKPRSISESFAAAPPPNAPAADEPASDEDPYGDDLPVTAPRYLTRRIELPWGGMELWKVAAGALLVLGLGTTMLFSGGDGTTPANAAATMAATSPAAVPPGKSDVVLYSAPGDPKVIDSVASTVEPAPAPAPASKPAEASSPRRTASTTPSRPASKPAVEEDETDDEELPAGALSAPTIRSALRSIDAALDPNSLVSKLARARSAVDSVNRLQVRTGFEPK